MTKKTPQAKIVNCQTGEEIIQDASPEQIAEFERIAIEKATARAEIEAKQLARQAILDRLNLTADEVKLLLG